MAESASGRAAPGNNTHHAHNAHADQHDQSATQSDIKRVATASLIGSTLEWYDFFIFGSAAALIFSELFFPKFDPVAGTIASLASFAVGFIARPVGGMVFGHYGDRIGRKAMLVLSLTMMGGVTFLIGLLPTYQTIGLGAPILLTVLRFLQGFAVGGEWGGATLMVVEHSPVSKRGFYGSWPQVGIPAALLLSTGVMAATTTLTTPAQFADWGWRLPFLFSGVLVVVGIIIRRTTTESPSFKRLKKLDAQVRQPMAEVLKSHKKLTAKLVAMQAIENTGFYVLAVYSLVYLTQNLHIPKAQALEALMVSAACLFIAQPFFGALSDRIGRRKVYMGGIIFLTLFIYPFFLMLQTGDIVWITLAMSLAMAFGEGPMQSVKPSLFSEQYGAGIRYTGVSMAYQFATVVWSGPTPIIAAMLVAWAGGYQPLVGFVIGAGIIALLAILRVRETSGIDLSAVELPGAGGSAASSGHGQTVAARHAMGRK